MKHYLSFGAGVNSVALYLLMENLGMEFEAIFVDHGGDLPETYEYVDYFVKSGRLVTILKPHVFVKKLGKSWEDLYQYSWDREVTPSMMFRWCTGEFKAKVVEKYVSRPCFQHLGIDAGEAKRAKINSTKGIESRWLLIEHDIDRDGCKEMIAAAGLIVPPKSGCWFCPFQGKAQWRELRRKHPDLFCKAKKLEQRDMDRQIRNGNPEPHTLKNNGRTIDQFINDKQLALPGLEEMKFPPCQCGL